MLITCPDCQYNVSDVAPACPKCGRPLAATTTESTGKWWKGLQVIGMAVACVCVASFVVFPASRRLAIAFGIAGVASILWGRVGAWWCHG